MSNLDPERATAIMIKGIKEEFISMLKVLTSRGTLKLQMFAASTIFLFTFMMINVICSTHNVFARIFLLIYFPIVAFIIIWCGMGVIPNDSDDSFKKLNSGDLEFFLYEHYKTCRRHRSECEEKLSQYYGEKTNIVSYFYESRPLSRQIILNNLSKYNNDELSRLFMCSWQTINNSKKEKEPAVEFSTYNKSYHQALLIKQEVYSRGDNAVEYFTRRVRDEIRFNHLDMKTIFSLESFYLGMPQEYKMGINL